MARKVIKTMAAKMAETGRSEGRDVLDDSDLSDDPIVSALQTLRVTIDDIQFNNENHGTDKIQSLIDANTAKTGISSEQAALIVATDKAAKDNTESIKAKDLSLTAGKTITFSVLESRGSYSLTIIMNHGSVKKTATIALR